MKLLRKETRLSLALALMALTTNVSAQEQSERTKSVYLELGGASNGIGVNYDARFKEGSPWGYRVGLGWGYGKVSSLFANSESVRAYSVPMGVNYFLGGKRNHLEMGLGVNIGLYNRHYYEYHLTPSPENPKIAEINAVQKKDNVVAGFGFANIGYRHVAKRGFQFRVGVTGGIGIINAEKSNNKFSLMPYISFGKAF